MVVLFFSKSSREAAVCGSVSKRGSDNVVFDVISSTNAKTRMFIVVECEVFMTSSKRNG